MKSKGNRKKSNVNRKIVKRKTNKRIRTRKPAAYVKTNRTAFVTKVVDNTTIRVSGYDLIYNIDENIVDGPFCVIPANPAYWEGTRVATIANAYSQYRPIKVKFHYNPQVSTMTNGNIIAGTLWNNVPGSNTTRQALATSNGGKLFPIYERASCDIKLKANLQQNLFNFQGFLSNEVNPFTFIAMSQHSNNLVPGYFMVEYVYEFKNPIGDGFEYSTKVMTADSVTVGDVWDNTTAMLLSETTLASIGTKLLVKVVENAVEYFLGGSRVGLAAGLLIKLFKSRSALNAKIDDDIQNDSESNILTGAYASLMNTEAGVSVTNQFQLPTRITKDDFVTFKVAQNGYDYEQVAGLFFKLKYRSENRADIELYMLSKVVETIPDDMYVFKIATPIGDEYSYIMRRNPPDHTNNVACTQSSVIMNESITIPLTYTLALPANPTVIKDVYIGVQPQAELTNGLKVLRPVT